MNSLETMKTRLNYNGGKKQRDRYDKDKLDTLKDAMLYSYQAATAQFNNGKEFRCLINRDKIKEDYDNKVISIPFKDICLTTNTLENTEIKEGTVFKWKENNTDWIVFLKRLEETAYFRAEIRRCKSEIIINDISYKVYINKTNEASVDWRGRSEYFYWNNLSYNLLMFITKDDNTMDFFSRFKKVKIDGVPWEVAGVDANAMDGIIVVALKEDFSNIIETEDSFTPEEEKPNTYINGDNYIYPYEEREYNIVGAEDGEWEISNQSIAKLKNSNSNSTILEILTGRSGSVNLIYKRENQEDIVLPITIKSL